MIVNVIGTGALKPMGSYMIGGAANAALNHFTKALADEGSKKKVRVVGVNPGPILTERLQRFISTFSPQSGSPEEALQKMTPIGRGRPARRGGRPDPVSGLGQSRVHSWGEYHH